MANMRVGLLGGSFNPAHTGHLHVSVEALKRLGLHEVWWLVSPQNPMKPRGDMAPLEARLAGARSVARHPRVRATPLEATLGTIYTVDTVNVLTRRFPGVRFIWIMGADNWLQMPAWKAWTQIFHAVVIAVFARPSYSVRVIAAKAARRFSRHRVRNEEIARLASKPPPAWAFLPIPLNAQSATRIRARLAGRAVGPANGNDSGEVQPYQEKRGLT
jgi:nicotinate-nucleotide adenylyltransferase